MKTKVGQALLKELSDKMTDLNTELVKMGADLKKLGTTARDKAKARELTQDTRTNRQEYDKLQAEITDLIRLEQWI